MYSHYNKTRYNMYKIQHVLIYFCLHFDSMIASLFSMIVSRDLATKVSE